MNDILAIAVAGGFSVFLAFAGLRGSQEWDPVEQVDLDTGPSARAPADASAGQSAVRQGRMSMVVIPAARAESIPASPSSNATHRAGSTPSRSAASR